MKDTTKVHSLRPTPRATELPEEICRDLQGFILFDSISHTGAVIASHTPQKSSLDYMIRYDIASCFEGISARFLSLWAICSYVCAIEGKQRIE